MFVHVRIESSDSDQLTRLDAFLHHKYPVHSRAYFQGLIERGFVQVNGRAVKKSYVLEVHDSIEVHLEPVPELQLIPQDIPLDVLYEDEWLLAVNKPAGMVVHPGNGNLSETFANALVFYCKNLEQDGSLRPGIVHRLDKDTTGVLLAAKTTQAHQALSHLFASRKIQKQYVALCCGKLPEQASSIRWSTISAPIGRHPIYRKEMAVIPNSGKHAISHYKVLASRNNVHLFDIAIETGRTHQIRVHCKYIGCPVLGDPVYGNKNVNKSYGIEKICLHCSLLSFVHPLTGEHICINAPISKEMDLLQKRLFS